MSLKAGRVLARIWYQSTQMCRLPQVSIVSATFNHPRTLQRHLEAIARQDYQGKIEVLLCDDGSDGDVLHGVRETANRLGLDVKYIWQPDRGFRLSRSRNNGMRAAINSIIIFVDADVLFDCDFVAQHVSCHDGVPRVVLGSRHWAFANPELWTLQKCATDTLIRNLRSRAKRLATDINYQDRMLTSTTPWAACSGCNFSICPAEGLEFDEHFIGWGFEDWEFVFRLTTQHSYQLQFQHEVTVYHIEFRHPATSKAQRPQTQDEILSFLRSAIYFVDKHPSVDTTPVGNCLLRYDCDPDSGTLTFCSNYKRRNRTPREAVEWARQCLASHSHVKSRRSGPC